MYKGTNTIQIHVGQGSTVPIIPLGYKNRAEVDIKWKKIYKIYHWDHIKNKYYLCLGNELKIQNYRQTWSYWIGLINPGTALGQRSSRVNIRSNLPRRMGK